jgi:hypothetical protein
VILLYDNVGTAVSGSVLVTAMTGLGSALQWGSIGVILAVIGLALILVGGKTWRR